MLRSVVFASALALTAGVAAAADLPPPVTMPPAPMLSPTPIAYNWSGFYFGAHGGYGFSDGDLDDGFVIGGQIGINKQWNNFVLGAEGDGSFTDWGDTNAVGTLRLRGGIAIDRILVYGTGGVAIGDDLGWVAGGGFEYAFNDRLSAGIEYLHYDMDEGSSDVIRGRVNWKFNMPY
jgi:outer membrane immunogenic protein